jgi:hypothetical protein
MKNRYRFLKKSYAMQRMSVAIERAIAAPTIKEKERAARWAAAWGLLCGVTATASDLKRGDIGQYQVPSAPGIDDQYARFAQAGHAQQQPDEPAPPSC